MLFKNENNNNNNGNGEVSAKYLQVFTGNRNTKHKHKNKLLTVNLHSVKTTTQHQRRWSHLLRTCRWSQRSWRHRIYSSRLQDLMDVCHKPVSCHDGVKLTAVRRISIQSIYSPASTGPDQDRGSRLSRI